MFHSVKSGEELKILWFEDESTRTLIYMDKSECEVAKEEEE